MVVNVARRIACTELTDSFWIFRLFLFSLWLALFCSLLMRSSLWFPGSLKLLCDNGMRLCSVFQCGYINELCLGLGSTLLWCSIFKMKFKFFGELSFLCNFFDSFSFLFLLLFLVVKMKTFLCYLMWLSEICGCLYWMGLLHCLF